MMVWVGIGCEGKTDITFIFQRLNATAYKNLIEEQLPLHGERISGCDYTFQHDNALIHRAGVDQNCLTINHIVLLEWPARSST